jgi:hypothetical protein
MLEQRNGTLKGRPLRGVSGRIAQGPQGGKTISHGLLCSLQKYGIAPEFTSNFRNLLIV